MNADKTNNSFSICVYLCSSAVLFFLSGCAANPSSANIELRKQIQSLQKENADLKRAHGADAATIQSLQQQKGTLATLPQDRLEQLFTVHGLSLGKLTGEDEGVLKIYVVPTDDSGQVIKAAGSFTVDAFDLAKQGDNSIGHWEFSTAAAKDKWFGHAMLYTYVLDCPWQQKPQHQQLTLKVTFKDELTQREFTVQKVVTVNAQ